MRATPSPSSPGGASSPADAAEAPCATNTGFSAHEAHLDDRPRQGLGYFGRGLRERVHQREAKGGIEGEQQAISRRADVLSAHRGGARQVETKRVDQTGDVHRRQNDTILVSWQHHRRSASKHYADLTAARPAYAAMQR